MTYRRKVMSTFVCSYQGRHTKSTYNENLQQKQGGLIRQQWRVVVKKKFKTYSVSRIVHCPQQQQLLLQLYHVWSLHQLAMYSVFLHFTVYVPYSEVSKCKPQLQSRSHTFWIYFLTFDGGFTHPLTSASLSGMLCSLQLVACLNSELVYHVTMGDGILMDD